MFDNPCPGRTSLWRSQVHAKGEDLGCCQRQLAEHSPLVDFCSSAVTDRSSVWTWCHWKHDWGCSQFGNTSRRTTDILLWSAAFSGALLSNFLALLGPLVFFTDVICSSYHHEAVPSLPGQQEEQSLKNSGHICLHFSAPAKASTYVQVLLTLPGLQLTLQWILQPLFIFGTGI